MRTSRVSGNGGCRSAVAQVVDIDFPRPSSLGHIRRVAPGVSTLDQFGNGLTEGLDFIPVMPPLKRHHDVQPFATRCLYKTLKANFFQERPYLMRALDDPRPRHTRIGIEIEKHPVR